MPQAYVVPVVLTLAPWVALQQIGSIVCVVMQPKEPRQVYLGQQWFETIRRFLQRLHAFLPVQTGLNAILQAMIRKRVKYLSATLK